MAGARRAAVEALIRIHRDGGYSNIVLDTVLRSGEFSPQDKALLSRLVYGVVERRLTLDYVINAVSSMKLRKMHPTVRDILRVGVYQLLYMDKVPDSAAVNESVKLAKAMGQGKASGFINAVLRNTQRQRATLLDGAPSDVLYSVPAEWIGYWRRQYGREVADGMLAALCDPPPQSIRINTLQISADAFCQRLTAAGIPFDVQPDLPEGLHIPSGFDWKGLAKIEENWYYYQDTASQYCCRALEACPGERIADVCAAPGGKSFTVAQYMQNKGYLLSGDVYPQKCDTIARRAEQYGITCLETVVRDASTPVPPALVGAFDRVLCDAPCSGLGVIRRKPEIRYKSLAETESLPALQAEILDRAAEMVRPGGVLQYSTCTLKPEENEQMTAAFLERHAEFAPRLLSLPACFAAAGLPISHQITLFPHIHNTDGFFIASFEKKRDT